jgi:hypothetical protein
MLKYDVIEFVHQNSESMILFEVLEELRIVNHLELGGVLVNSHTSRGNPLGWVFMDATGECREERLLLEKPESVKIKIKRTVSHRKLRFGWEVLKDYPVERRLSRKSAKINSLSLTAPIISTLLSSEH